MTSNRRIFAVNQDIVTGSMKFDQLQDAIADRPLVLVGYKRALSAKRLKYLNDKICFYVLQLKRHFYYIFLWQAYTCIYL